MSQFNSTVADTEKGLWTTAAFVGGDIRHVNAFRIAKDRLRRRGLIGPDRREMFRFRDRRLAVVTP
jgi:hypothetical protein